MIIEQGIYYIVREKKTGTTAKGTKGYGAIGSGVGTIRKSNSPPKLYNIGPAKGLVTSRKKYNKMVQSFTNPQPPMPELEIIPVTVIFGEPLDA